MKLVKTSSGQKLRMSMQEWLRIGQSAGWDSSSTRVSNWDRLSPRAKLNWKDRSELEAILESVGIASYPNETDEELKDAIITNIKDGTLDLSVIE